VSFKVPSKSCSKVGNSIHPRLNNPPPCSKKDIKGIMPSVRICMKNGELEMKISITTINKHLVNGLELIIHGVLELQTLLTNSR